MGIQRALGEVARDVRLEAGLTILEMAVAAKCSTSTIHRFEAGVWGPKTEEVLDAYAAKTGVSVKELWMRAVDTL